MRTTTLGNASLLILLTSAISAACGESDDKRLSSDAGTADAPSATDAASRSDANAADAQVDSAQLDGAADSACPPGYQEQPDGGCLPVTVRRPFLVGSSLRFAAAVERSDWSHRTFDRPALDATTAARLTQAWLKDALEEHASVAAFARFTMQLLAIGAPRELVARSQIASLDEIRHAEMCFVLAERYGGRALGPGALRVHDSLAQLSLVELAVLTAEEGCVGETLGAALAAEQLSVATDPGVRGVLERIARDEARHSELAWRFVRWAVLRGGDAVANAVARAVPRAVASTLEMEIQRYDGIDLDAWHAHGRLTCAESRAVVERAANEVVLPCLEQVLEIDRPHSVELRA